MSKGVLAVLVALGALGGCQSGPDFVADYKAPTYSYQPLGGLDPERVKGQSISLSYDGERYKVAPQDERLLRLVVAEEVMASSMVERVRANDAYEPIRTIKLAGIDLKDRWQYQARVKKGLETMNALAGLPVPARTVSADPATPCQIKLPPPRNAGDAEFFRALGEATYACMR